MLRVRYEDLRTDVLRSSDERYVKNQSMVLFLRSGMLGWMESWSRCTVGKGELEGVKQPEKQRNIPIDFRDKVVELLTTMIIGIRKEVVVN